MYNNKNKPMLRYKFGSVYGDNFTDFIFTSNPTAKMIWTGDMTLFSSLIRKPGIKTMTYDLKDDGHTH